MACLGGRIGGRGRDGSGEGGSCVASADEPGGPGEELEGRVLEPDAEAVARFVERFAAVLVQAGLTRMPARVFAALLVAENGSITSAELVEQLQVSPAAVSGAVRYLSQFRLVSVERDPGSRRDRYRLLDDIWFHASASRDGALLSWETASREGAELFGYDSPVGRRFAQSVEYFEFLRKEIAGVFARWQEYKNSQAGAGRSPSES